MRSEKYGRQIRKDSTFPGHPDRSGPGFRDGLETIHWPCLNRIWQPMYFFNDACVLPSYLLLKIPHKCLKQMLEYWVLHQNKEIFNKLDTHHWIGRCVWWKESFWCNSMVTGKHPNTSHKKSRGIHKETPSRGLVQCRKTLSVDGIELNRKISLIDVGFLYVRPIGELDFLSF
jgi:hypothetical protein